MTSEATSAAAAAAALMVASGVIDSYFSICLFTTRLELYPHIATAAAAAAIKLATRLQILSLVVDWTSETTERSACSSLRGLQDIL